MAKVRFWRGNTEEINNQPIIDGQMLFDIDTGITYQDVGDIRKQLGVKVEDTITNEKDTWSSAKIQEEDNKTWKAAVDSMASPLNETDNVVSCYPVKDYPLEVITHIEPQQEGEGEPSPTNIRPIKGWNKLELVKCGSNLVKNRIDASSRNGITIDSKADGTIHVSGNATIYTFIDLIVPEIIYTRLAGIDVNALGTEKIVNGFVFRDVVFRAVKEYNHACFVGVPVGTIDKVFHPMIAAIGNNDFVPYSGETYTQSLPERVFGGSYGWQSGKLTSEMAVVHDAKLWDENTPSVAENWFSVFGNTYNEGIILCNKLPVTPWNIYDTARLDSPIMWKFKSSNGIAMPYALVPGITKESSIAEKINAVKAYLGDYDILVRSTPKTTQLTPTPNILSKEGVNTLYSNTGKTQVKGRANPAHEINELKKAIVSMGGNI